MNVMVPNPSMYWSFSLNGSRRRPSLEIFNFKKTRMESRVKLPIGTLLHRMLELDHQAFETRTYIQKHHLQETRSVKVPPRTGPTHTLIPNIPTRNPRCKGLFSITTVYATMPRAPWKRPAAPTPATARPTIKVGELLATAQIIEPTTKWEHSAAQDGKGQESLTFEQGNRS